MVECKRRISLKKHEMSNPDYMVIVLKIWSNTIYFCMMKTFSTMASYIKIGSHVSTEIKKYRLPRNVIVFTKFWNHNTVPILYIRAWYDKIKLLWRPKNVSRLVILKTSSFWKTLHKFYSWNHIISWKYT